MKILKWSLRQRLNKTEKGENPMPYPKFDRTKLNILPLNERIHDIDLEKVAINPGDEFKPFDHPALEPLADAVVNARKKNATVLMMYGAHVIRTGNSPLMIDLMKRGLITHFATNGAGSIHDFEFSLIGHTCESVAKYISEGQFGLWKETGIINDIINDAAKEGLGWGEALGRYIYFADAAADRKKDLKKENYNPLIRMSSSHIMPCAGLLLGEASEAYAKLDFTCDRGITDNIMYSGIPMMLKSKLRMKGIENFDRKSL